MYSDLPEVAERVYSFASGVPHVVVARARLDRRGEAFGFVGLSSVWRALRGLALPRAPADSARGGGFW
jgi:hypothetical protein